MNDTSYHHRNSKSMGDTVSTAAKKAADAENGQPLFEKEEAGLFSKFHFSWMNTLLSSKGTAVSGPSGDVPDERSARSQHHLSEDQLGGLPARLTSHSLYERFINNLQNAVRPTKDAGTRSFPSDTNSYQMSYALYLTFRKELLISGIYKLVTEVVYLLLPLLIFQLLQVIKTREEQGQQDAVANDHLMVLGCLHSLSIFLVITVTAYASKQQHNVIKSQALSIRSILQTAIYRKALCLSNYSRQVPPQR